MDTSDPILTRRRMLAWASAAAGAAACPAGAEELEGSDPQPHLSGVNRRSGVATRGTASVHETLNNGREPFLGLFQMHPNPVFGELAGECGYDFLILDGEHGVLEDKDFAESLTVLAATDTFGFVRLPDQSPQALRRYLEMGADAIVVPNVSTVEQTRTLAGAMSAHREAGLIVLIESALGVANAEQILAVEGVTGAFIGPNDLSADIGRQGEYTHPAYLEAFARIERAAASAGKVLGTLPHGDYSLKVLRSRGHRLLVLGSDRQLQREAMNAQIGKARASLS